jgi:DNA invertase Pin-like site-specific DNA recombinase
VKLGYERVSTDQQTTEGQHLRLVEAGVDRIFTDEAVSGRKASRPELDKMLDMLRPGDVVVAVRLDRLGRSVKNLIELVDRIQKAGADIHILDQGIDTRTPAGRLIFHIFAALAEFEAAVIRERTMDGLAAARERGLVGGSQKGYTAEHCRAAQALKDQGMTAAEVGLTLGKSRATIYRMLAELETVAP